MTTPIDELAGIDPRIIKALDELKALVTDELCHGGSHDAEDRIIAGIDAIRWAAARSTPVPASNAKDESVFSEEATTDAEAIERDRRLDRPASNVSQAKSWHEGMTLVVHPDGTKCWHRVAVPASNVSEGLREAVDEATSLIETGENRAMAADGPVTHFRGELDDREWRRLWVALSQVRAALAHAAPEGLDDHSWNAAIDAAMEAVGNMVPVRRVGADVDLGRGHVLNVLMGVRRIVQPDATEAAGR